MRSNREWDQSFRGASPMLPMESPGDRLRDTWTPARSVTHRRPAFVLREEDGADPLRFDGDDAA
jgi:hypothetical protein